MIDVAVQRSRELFESGLFCAESVLLAAAEGLGVNSDLIPRIASGVCSGLARTGGLCGALSGALLVVGMGAGRDAADESIEPTYELVREVIRGFEARFGATTCMGLTGCDLATDEGQRAFRDRGQRALCTGYVGEATRMALAALGKAN